MWSVVGNHQREGLDFQETFCPVVKPTTVRLVLSLAVSFQWIVRQLDVKNAFLHGHLTEEVYMRQPSGFIHLIHFSHVCRLHKALYGLRQAPRAWFHCFSSFLLRSGFTQAKSDSSMFVYHRHSQVIILVLYVDDIVVTGTSHTLLSSFISVLSSEFAMKDLGDIHYFLAHLQIFTGYFILWYLPSPSDISLLVAYSDADWAGCPDNARSTTGFAIYLGSNLISWQVKKQFIVSKSSTEAEYRTVAYTVADTLWIRSLLAELDFPIVKPVRERMMVYGRGHVSIIFPLSALSEKKIICMHGGIGRSINSVDQIEKLERPITMDAGSIVLMDLLWSDPTENDSIEGLRPNARGPGLITFGGLRFLQEEQIAAHHQSP
ncbi:Retrovirus-related Pol polyprotein from transposon RE1-like protein [Drosera capensis]